MTGEELPRLERLVDVTRALGSTPDLDAFLQTVIAAAAELTDSQAAAILEYEAASETLRFSAASAAHWEALRTLHVPVEGSAAGWVYLQGKALHIPDTRTDARHFKAADFASAFETHSLLAVPLMVRGKPLGVLEAVNKNNAHYTEEDTTILETLAASAALAIDNAGLQRRAQASLSELSEIDRLKNDFIAITSHELRTPLGVILGHATFLRELMDEEYHEQMDVIVKNAARLKEIIEGVARIDDYETGGARLRQRPVSIAHLIREAASSLNEMASQHKITLKTDLGGDDLFAEADAAKVSDALNNLIKNALMFTDEDGHVTVAGQAVPGYIKVSVIDDGIGIPARDLPRIFERFFQIESHLTRKHGGMGLGLSVAKVMIEMHGGRIWVESEEGKGSTFSFLLPVRSTQGKAGSHAPSS
jgi:signal transduction histidine kinase